MERQFTVAEHLEELRQRIIVSLFALGIATLVSVPFAHFLLRILKLPAGGAIEKLAFFSPEEGFLIYMRVSFIAGLIFSFPIIAYQIWAFFAPAIRDDYKRYVAHFVLFVSLAFLGGCAFAYLVLLPNALRFLLGIGNQELVAVISATKYISFVTAFIVACGLIFQMPILSFFLTYIRLVNAKLLRRNFMFAIIIIFILAAVITPTGDAFNMLVLAMPMVFLYEVSIWVSSLTDFSRRRARNAGQ